MQVSLISAIIFSLMAILIGVAALQPPPISRLLRWLSDRASQECDPTNSLPSPSCSDYGSWASLGIGVTAVFGVVSLFGALLFFCVGMYFPKRSAERGDLLNRCRKLAIAAALLGIATYGGWYGVTHHWLMPEVEPVLPMGKLPL